MEDWYDWYRFLFWDPVDHETGLCGTIGNVHAFEYATTVQGRS